MPQPTLPSVRELILWLVIGCMVPSMAGALFIFQHNIQDAREELEKTSILSARIISLEVDHTFSQVKRIALLSSRAPQLQAGNLAVFHQNALLALAKFGIDATLVVSDTRGQQVLNTLTRFGADLPPYGDQAQLREVIATGKPVLSNLFIGGVSKKPIVTVAVPVVRQGEIVYVLSLSINPESLNAMVRGKNFPADWLVTVFDAQGTIAARSHDFEKWVGHKPSPDVEAKFPQADEGSFETESQEGIAVLSAFSTAPDSRWRVGIGISRPGLEAAVRHQVVLIGAGLLSLFGMGLALALFLGGRISKSVARLARPAQDLIAGKPLVAPEVYFQEAQEVALAMANTAQQLAASANNAHQVNHALRASELALKEMNESLEAKVRERAQELLDLYEQSPIGYHTLDAQGVVTQVNQAQLDLLGYSRQEYVGQKVTKFFTQEFQAKFSEVLPQAFKDGSLRELEFEFIAKSGDQIPVVVNANVARNSQGQVVSIRSTIVDNRQNLAQKQQLKDLNHFLREVLETVPLGVAVLDPDRQVVLKNTLLGKLLGFTPELAERADLTFSDIVRFNHDKGEFPGQSYETVLAGFMLEMDRQETVNYERHQHNGKYLAICSRPIGERWILLTYANITEAKLLALALQESKQAADDASRAKSEFLSSMSHELRTPLNAVIGLNDLLAQSPLNARQRNYVGKVKLSAQVLKTLIDDILDFSKIEANELHLEEAPFSLHELLNTTASVLGVGVGHRAIEPVLDVPADMPDAMFGDALRLQQILLNLVSNAVKFTQTGEIVVSVRRLPQATVSDPSQAVLEFRVRDTGIGMTEETQALIFNSFTQADESTSRLYGGSGLGLAISRRLATLMQGQLEVHSALGQGTEFCLTLPVWLDQNAPAQRPDEAEDPYIPADLRLLIVEDHPIVRDLLAQTCRQRGWQARVVDSGAAALQALMNRSEDGPDYDLVLLDWHMPGMDGLALLREVYQSPERGLPPVILMVATAEIERAVAASGEFDIHSIVAKPLLPSRLRQAVAQALLDGNEGFERIAAPQQRILAGLHLLVAEDNALNQEVIEQMLLSAGARVTLVGNGQLAVEALQAPGARFDAVLMDVQMPVLDGYAATRVIRHTLGRVDLPIIALTAFARPQDREQSRRAGMSGHLSKPLDAQELLEVLVNAVGSRGTTGSSAAASKPAPELRVPGQSLAQSLEAFGGEPGAYYRLVSRFLAQQGSGLAQARSSFAVGDTEGASQRIHSLGGMAGLLQMGGLSLLAEAAESAMRGGRSDQLPDLFDQLQAALDALSASMQEFDATVV